MVSPIDWMMFVQGYNCDSNLGPVWFFIYAFNSPNRLITTVN